VTNRGPTEPRGGLWRHRDFLKLWSAQSISVLGSQVTLLALPLAAILVFDATAFEVALLSALEFAPFLLFALPAGVWVDRWPRRPVLIAADVGRALALFSVPAAYAADILTIWQLYAVAFGTGVLTVFFDVAYMSYLPALVRREQLVEGNAKLEISRSSAYLAGPGLGGGLVELVKAPLAILVDAVSFVVSAVLIAAIRRPEDVTTRTEARRAGMRAELVEGLRYVLGEPHIRAIASSTTTFNFFSNVTWALLLVYAVRDLDLTPGVIGLIFGIGNVGSLGAAFTSGWISRRLGVGRAIVLGAMGGLAMLLVPLASKDTAVPFLIASGVIVGFGVVLYNTAGISLMQAITPDRLLGRMNASRRFLVWGTIPLGALTGGAIASITDVRTAIWVGAIGNALAFLPVLLSPVRSLREIPETEHPASPDVGDAAPEPIVP
jgi:MFS family permease